MEQPAVALEDVTKRFGAVTVLDGISLAFPAHRTTVLLGASGCGKSTILRAIVGLVAPDAGVVRVRGEVLSPGNARRIRHGLGYVVQEGGLFPHLTARGNVTLLARHLGWDEDRIARRVDELTRLVRLAPEMLDRYPAQLSGGQRQRVGLMRALALDPEVLLLDEPLGALDPIVRRELQEDLREIFRGLGKSVVMVTHDLGEAAFFADVVVLMKDGRIAQRGTTADLLHAPADDYVSRFVRAQRSPLDAVA